MKERNFGLDVLRACSILLVLIAHFHGGIVEVGAMGVQFFFVLSGFLVGQILLQQLSRGLDGRGLINFWKRRWFRILPLYYLMLFVKIAIYGNPYGWKMLVYFLFLQANFLGIDFYTVTWSLVVEEWFYIFLPLLSWVIFRSNFSPGRYLRFLIISIVLIFLVRFFWVYFKQGIIVYQFDCIFLGVLLALLKLHYFKAYRRLFSPVIFWSALFVICLLVYHFGSSNRGELFSTYHRVVWHFMVSFCVACTIPFVEQSVFINQVLKRISPVYGFFTLTSVLTYSIYLIHADIFQIPAVTSNAVLQGAIIFVLLYFFSFLIYALYEYPMMQLRERFTFQQYIAAVDNSFRILGR